MILNHPEAELILRKRHMHGLDIRDVNLDLRDFKTKLMKTKPLLDELQGGMKSCQVKNLQKA